MAFRNGCFASVWEVKPAESGKYTDAKISISTKRKDTQAYVQDFTGTVRFIGDANTAIQKYAGRTVGEDRKPIARLRLDDVSATVSKIEKRDGSGSAWYTSFQCYACSEPDAQPQASAAPSTDRSFVNIPEDVGSEERLPFS